MMVCIAGAAGAEERHGPCLCHEDFEEGRHVGEGTGMFI